MLIPLRNTNEAGLAKRHGRSIDLVQEYGRIVIRRERNGSFERRFRIESY